MRLVVSKMRLKPMIKNSVGGQISSNSRLTKAPARRKNPADVRIDSAAASICGVSCSLTTGAPLIRSLLFRVSWVFTAWAVAGELANNTTEADMARRGVDRLRMSRRRTVTAAVVRRTQMRAALQHLARNLDFGLAGVVARVLRPAPRVQWDAAVLLGICLVSRRVPVAGPFPHIADHVVDAVTVWRECRDRRGALVPVELQVLARKGALPGVCHRLAAGREFIAPGELLTVEPAARGKFPFRLGRQVLARPFGVCHGVAIRDVNHGMVIEPAERAARTVGPPPVGAKLECPPLAPVAQIIDRMLWRAEHQRAGPEHVRQSAWIVLRIRRDFGEGDMAGRPDELAELPVCHRSAIDPEGIDRHVMNRRLFRIMLVRADAEGAAGKPDHIGVGRAFWGPILRPKQCDSVKLCHPAPPA